MFRLRSLFSLAVVGAATAGVGVYQASQSVPDFYEQTIAIPPSVADQGGREFTATTVALASRAQKEGEWDALYTDAQVNGWLATDLPAKHPDLLPPGYEHPRVKFVENGIQVGVRCDLSGVQTVVWLDVQVKMTGAHEAALQFRRVRAGLLPLPLAEVLEALSQTAEQLELPLRWTTTDGHPTAVIGLPTLGSDGLRYDLDTLQVGDGKLYVAGRTARLAAGERTTIRR